MKNLVLASLIALTASQAAGCIIESDDDFENAYISATWTLRAEATNTTAPCPPGFDTAALYNQPVDGNDNPVGDPFIDLFNCSAGSGTSAALPPQRYLTWVEIANSNNTSQYAQSLSALVDVTTSDKTFNTQILVDGGYFQLQWGLVDAVTNQPLSCASGNVDGVESIGTLVSNPSYSNSDIFDCEDNYGITAGYVQGTYTVAVAAVNAADQRIGPTVELTNKVIQGPNKVTSLGTINVPVD